MNCTNCSATLPLPLTILLISSTLSAQRFLTATILYNSVNGSCPRVATIDGCHQLRLTLSDIAVDSRGSGDQPVESTTTSLTASPVGTPTKSSPSLVARFPINPIKFIISVAHCRLDFTKKKTEKIQAQCYLGGGLPSLSPALWNQYPVFYSASWSVNAVCSIESSFVRTAKRVCTGQQATTADSRYGECESEINIYVSFLVDFHHLGQFIKHSNAFYIYFLPKF